MGKTFKTIFVSLLLNCIFSTFVNQVAAQEIHDGRTYTEGGVTYTKCWQLGKTGPNNGAKVNGKLVVPCKYDYVYGKAGYLFARPGDSDTKICEVYSIEGTQEFPIAVCIVDAVRLEKQGLTLFKDESNDWWDVRWHTYFRASKIEPVEINNMTLIKIINGNKFGYAVMDFASDKYEKHKIIFEPKYDIVSDKISIVSDANTCYFKVQENFRHNGIYDIDGNAILEPEFQDCDYLGNNLFSFKMNGYWGVMKKDGTIIIPLSRQYSSISYSRTFKKFTFEKRVNNVVYKGECNANGVQTVIQKDHTIPPPSAKTTTSTQPAKTTTTQPEKKTKPTPAPQPQPRQPQPMQVWVQCLMCNGSGRCHICGGLGWKYTTYDSHATCTICGGSGKCNQCAGHGGHNEIQYR